MHPRMYGSTESRSVFTNTEPSVSAAVVVSRVSKTFGGQRPTENVSLEIDSFVRRGLHQSGVLPGQAPERLAGRGSRIPLFRAP
jgi:hypothetical protein